MRARLVLDVSAEELAAACGESGGSVDAVVVEVTSRDGRVSTRPAMVQFLSHAVNRDLPDGVGAAVRVYLRTPAEAEEPDGGQ